MLIFRGLLGGASQLVKWVISNHLHAISAIWKGNNPPLGDLLSTVMSHLQAGMILHVSLANVPGSSSHRQVSGDRRSRDSQSRHPVDSETWTDPDLRICWVDVFFYPVIWKILGLFSTPGSLAPPISQPSF